MSELEAAAAQLAGLSGDDFDRIQQAIEARWVAVERLRTYAAEQAASLSPEQLQRLKALQVQGVATSAKLQEHRAALQAELIRLAETSYLARHVGNVLEPPNPTIDCSG